MFNSRQFFLEHLAQTSDEPLMVEINSADGVFLYGPDGRSWTDLISGIAVSNVGHNHPEVKAAIKEQVDNYLHTMVYGEFVLGPQVEYAKELADSLKPSGLSQVFFVNSGSEAVEGGLKLAKKFTGRRELLSFWNSYHGSTHGALSVTGADDLKKGYGPFLPEVNHLHFNKVSDLEKITNKTAAVLLEPIQGEAGIILPEEGYLKALRERCDATGTLLIFDEIQTGMGRTGELFAHQKFGVMPDILLLGKALGGGLPLGAFISSPEIMDVLKRDPVLGHITTFGGNPVCCAAGLAAFKLIRRERLHERAQELETIIREVLQHPGINELRGTGLMFAVVLNSYEEVQKVIHHCLENGVLTDWFLHADNCVRIAPPLVISDEELRNALTILKDGIDLAV